MPVPQEKNFLWDGHLARPSYFCKRFNLSKKPGFFDPSRKNSVSLALVRAVRRYEIVDLICKLLMATHPTILNRVQR